MPRDVCVGRLVVALFFAKLLPGVMGPGFRQDDSGVCRNH